MDHAHAAWDEGQAGLGFVVNKYAVADLESVPLEPVHVGIPLCATCVVGVRCRLGRRASLQFGQAHEPRSSIEWGSAGIGKRSLHRPHWRVGAMSSGVRSALVVVPVVFAVSVMAPRGLVRVLLGRWSRGDGPDGCEVEAGGGDREGVPDLVVGEGRGPQGRPPTIEPGRADRVDETAGDQ